MIIVGLTGNYGMGKSTVARLFRERGAVTIDTDAVVGELLQQQPVIDEIQGVFGDRVMRDSGINKKILADIVFQSPSLRIQLENILHPRVFGNIRDKISALGARAGVVIIEAPVLFERSYQSKFDKIVTVYAAEEITLQRLKEKGVSEPDAVNRLKNQFPVEMKISRSDFTIDNSNGFDDTARQVEAVYRELEALSSGLPEHSHLIDMPGPIEYGNN
jgi:dephospho-CoA kinase